MKLTIKTLAIGMLALALGIGAGRDSAARASLPERLELKSTDRVFWKGKAGENYLIINVFAHEARTKALPKLEQNKLYLNTALVEGARLLGRTEHSQLKSLSVLLVSMKDMSEYGATSGNWTQVGTATLLRGDAKVELKDVKLNGDLPAPIPTLAFPLQETSTAATTAGVRFMMPERVYVVAGIPQHLFFENLVTVKDADELVFQPSGPVLNFAAINRRGLTFNASDAHAGEHALTIKVADWEGKKIAEGTTKVVIVPGKTAGEFDKADPIRILVIGHSLPSMYWPLYLADYLAGPGNPPIAFVGGIKYWYGSYPDVKNNPPLDAMYHQASPSYSVKALLSRYSDTPPANPNMPSDSPFLFKDASGKASIDMKRYLAETLKGMPPHIVLLNVGDNDTFGLVPEEKDSAVEKEFIVHMNTFLDHLREIAPKATFGVMLPNTYNYTERSFLHNYGPNFTRWRQLQNRQRYIEIMADISKKRGDLVIIPSNLVVDGIDGMPYNSGTHFNNLGARQFAGAAFAWLKVQFTKPIDRTVKSDASQVTTGSIKTAAPGTPAPAPPPASEGSSWFSRSFKSVTGK